MNKIIYETDFQKARNRIREASKKGVKVIFSGNDDELNRKVLEKEKINVLLINLAGRKDYSKQRNSGFNQVLAKLAKKKGIALGINLDELIQANKEDKVKILSRLRQNIFLAKKNKLKMEFISKNKSDERNLKSLGLMLGMSTSMMER